MLQNQHAEQIVVAAVVVDSFAVERKTKRSEFVTDVDVNKKTTSFHSYEHTF